MEYRVLLCLGPYCLPMFHISLELNVYLCIIFLLFQDTVFTLTIGNLKCLTLGHNIVELDI